jgi:hypothetical protein
MAAGLTQRLQVVALGVCVLLGLAMAAAGPTAYLADSPTHSISRPADRPPAAADLVAAEPDAAITLRASAAGTAAAPPPAAPPPPARGDAPPSPARGPPAPMPR